jgi:tetratricopeptide (TPR) repeat protein
VNDEDLIRAHAANVAVSWEYAGRLPEALALLERVVALDAKAEAWRGELSDQVSLALVALRLRDFRKAEAAAKRAAELAREHGQQQELGNALGILGNIYAEEEEGSTRSTTTTLRSTLSRPADTTPARSSSARRSDEST